MSSKRQITVNINSSGLSAKKEATLMKKINESVSNIIKLSNCESKDKKAIKKKITTGTAKKGVVEKTKKMKAVKVPAVKVGSAKEMKPKEKKPKKQKMQIGSNNSFTKLPKGKEKWTKAMLSNAARKVTVPLTLQIIFIIHAYQKNDVWRSKLYEFGAGPLQLIDDEKYKKKPSLSDLEDKHERAIYNIWDEAVEFNPELEDEQPDLVFCIDK